MLKLIFQFLIFYNILIVPSYSYLGPGIGGGIIAATLGLVIAIFAAILGLIWFPIKKIFKKKDKDKDIDKEKENKKYFD